MSNRAEPDNAILGFAIRERRAVITLNRRHFVRLHGETTEHSGIVVCSVDPDFAALALRIHEALTPLDDLTGKLVRINLPADVAKPGP